MNSTLPEGYKKCVVIAAPHTSNWDFLYSLAVFFKLKLPVRYLAKKELFRWPIKSTLVNFGGIPVQRKLNTNMVDTMIEMFENTNELMLLIPAEGTRSKVTKWKTGFYNVALGANVPILLGYLDYKNKIAGFGPLLHMTGDKQKDANSIKDFYRNIQGKYPENFDVEGLQL